jgi:cephalosporin hydroxylase
MCKTFDDLDRYRDVIGRTSPDWLLETGSWTGRSAQWFRELVPEVVSVDREPQAHDRWGVNHRVTYLVGDSADAGLAARIAAQALMHGRRMVVLDSDHSAAHVLNEMELYGNLVTVGCYLVVEDTLTAYMTPRGAGYDGSPLDAVHEYMDRHPGMFVVDEPLENLRSTTQCPEGWLLRVGAA